ncbi:MAG: hypothetical protein CM15mP68_4680 [Pseudomonadota bacterium]|nr:MAG: hypothetical protein CM15mP68_4680 [Pseudomonadota bacterium]
MISVNMVAADVYEVVIGQRVGTECNKVRSRLHRKQSTVCTCLRRTIESYVSTTTHEWVLLKLSVLVGTRAQHCHFKEL